MAKNYWDQHDKSTSDLFKGGTPVFNSGKEAKTFSKHVVDVQNNVVTFLNKTSKAAIKNIKEVMKVQEALIKQQEKILAKKAKAKAAAGVFDIPGLLPEATKPQKAPGKGMSGFSGGLNPLDLKDSIKPLTSILKELSGELVRILPAIAVFGSISGIIVGVISKIFKLQDATSDFLRSLGGDEAKIERFNSSMVAMTATTRLSEEQIMSLSHAFIEAGVPMSKVGDGIEKYIYSSAKAIRMFDLSEKEAANLVRTLSMQGKSWNEIDNYWGELSSSMFEFNLSIHDANAAISDGTEMWDNYGAALGSNVQEFQRGVLRAKGLFRSLNIDASKVAGSMAAIFGDPSKKYQQAAYMSAAMGMSGSKAINLMSDPERAEEALEARIKTGLLTYQKLLGNQAQYMKYTPAQLRKMFGNSQAGEDKLASVNIARGFASEQMKALNFGPEFEGALRQYQSYGGNIDSFIPDMKKLQKEGATEGTMEDSLKALNNTMPELLKNLNNKLDAIFTQLANKISPHLPKLVEAIDKAASCLYDVTAVIISANAGIGDFYHWMKDSLFKTFTNLVSAITDPNGMLGKVLSPLLPNFAGSQTANTAFNLVTSGMNMFGLGGSGSKSSGGSNVIEKMQSAITKSYPETAKWAPADMKNAGFMSTGNAAFDKKIVEVAKKHGMNPAHLKAVMNLETGGTLSPSKKNRKSSATGLIQFMASTAKGLGTTTGDLAQMSQVEQMDYVDKYFSNKHIRPGNLQDTYMSVFSPAFIGKDANHPMYSAFSKSAKNREAYARNAGLDLNKDGVMTTGEAARAVEKWLKRDQAALAKLMAKNNALLEQQNNLLTQGKDDQKKHMEEIRRANIARDPSSLSYQNKVAMGSR